MGILLLGIWLVLFGIDLAGWVAISGVLLGIFALIIGIVLIIEHGRTYIGRL
jgi:hypothetical protein